ncbi:MAG: PSD1 and planctomycete cytochrome C domain-containing protein [Planctomycetota bacterium]|nr:PSD1 and planctomycete cytochrome C domain-containing protein [Planctomycetota bacterium]
MRPGSLEIVALLLSFSGVFTSPLSAEPDFEKEIAPLLVKRCLECHSPSEKKGDLDLSTYQSASAGGESGPALGKPGKSLLLKRISSGEMPPKLQGKSRKLPENEIALLREWIAAGAKWPKDRTLSLYERTTEKRGGLDWWSLQPLKETPVPEVKNTEWIANPIDTFIYRRLEKNSLQPAPRAGKRTLVRRAFFDLLGLPPTREQLNAFIKDDSPGAWEKLIDSLLESKHYGERWARYWLDLVRFAETCGYERDQLKPNIWKYRDWVINALNKDMPYDRFVIDQLAGDEVSHRDEQSVIATGMLRAGTWNDEPNDAADYVYTRLEDMVHTTTSAFVGLTVKCARCHDHKFDPIRQTDYYRTASFFWAGYIGQANLGGPNASQLGFNVFGWTDKGPKANPIHLLVKGDRHRAAQVVEPGFLSAVPALEKSLQPPPPGSKTTHRRLQLARWITHPENPLTARVLVNRLWQHHFGEGIVRTPNNFGFKSDPPSHPELLDWLASEAVRGGWKLKRLHKLIMMSSTYRQSSTHPSHDEYAGRDYANRLIWRFNRRRLDAEALRDSILTASGRLNKKMGGPSFFPRMSPEALEGLSRKATAWGSSPPEERSRRSIYMMSKRSRLLPLMTTFDFCDTTLSCGQRDVSLVPTQALALLNNHFVHEQSRAMAERVAAEAGKDQDNQVRTAWQIALGRSPTEIELMAATAHLESQAMHFKEQEQENLPLTSLCHVLLNTNEFIFID